VTRSIECILSKLSLTDNRVLSPDKLELSPNPGSLNNGLAQ